MFKWHSQAKLLLCNAAVVHERQELQNSYGICRHDGIVENIVLILIFTMLLWDWKEMACE